MNTQHQHHQKIIGLIGTVTKDYITFEAGPKLKNQNRIGIGGVLYQAAALCGMGNQVRLITQIGEELLPEFRAAAGFWKSLLTEAIYPVPGPGNQVHLHYPAAGEREEILTSVVPPLTAKQIIPFLSGLDILILVLNSGFDISLQDWKAALKHMDCPVWLDMHSLVLAKKIGNPREYVPFPEWQEWVEGVSYLQANKKELASALGDPEKFCGKAEILAFSRAAFDQNVDAVFITLGREGVMALTPGDSRKIQATPAGEVVDTTGCGDVFCAAAVNALVKGRDCFAAAEAGVKLATRAAETAGVEEIYYLAG